MPVCTQAQSSSSQLQPAEFHVGNIDTPVCFQIAQALQKGLSPRKLDSVMADQRRESFCLLLHQLWLLELDWTLRFFFSLTAEEAKI